MLKNSKKRPGTFGPRKPNGHCQQPGCGVPVWNRKLCKLHYNRINSRERMRHRRSDPIQRKMLLDKTTEFKRALRYEVLSHYSGEQPKCVICGFSDLRALCLDHINNDGAAHRKKLCKQLANAPRGSGSYAVYRDVKKNNYPPQYQVLCHNCNTIKQVNRHA